MLIGHLSYAQYLETMKMGSICVLVVHFSYLIIIYRLAWKRSLFHEVHIVYRVLGNVSETFINK